MRLGKYLIKQSVLLLSALFLVLSTPIIASASANGSVEAKIAAQAKVSGTDHTDSIFTYRLEAAEADVPLPEKQQLTAVGEEPVAFDITYTDPGSYRYTLTQIPGNAENWTYDTAVYTVEVYVLQDENLEKLEAHVFYYNEDGEKTDGIFVNKYTNPSVPSESGDNVVKTGDNGSLLTWAILLVICGVVIAAFYAEKTREN